MYRKRRVISEFSLQVLTFLNIFCFPERVEDGCFHNFSSIFFAIYTNNIKKLYNHKYETFTNLYSSTLTSIEFCIFQCWNHWPGELYYIGTETKFRWHVLVATPIPSYFRWEGLVFLLPCIILTIFYPISICSNNKEK